MGDFVVVSGGLKPKRAEIVGLEGIIAPPFDLPTEHEDPPEFVSIDSHTGREVPVLRTGEPPGTIERLRDYLGIRQRETGPLALEAIETGVRPFDIREEVFGTGREEEFRRVVGRGFSGLTGGIADLVRGYEEHPETWPGAVLGAGAELAGFLVGPYKGAKFITGTRLAPTSKGLVGVAQIMTQGAANLGIASMLSAVAPALLKSDTLTEMTFEIAESGAMGGLVGLLFPAMGAIPTKPLRIAVSLAVMDKIRAGPRQWFTIDDVVIGVKDGTIPAKDLARASFGYLMDIYFTLKVPSMKKQLAALDNMVMQEIAKQNPQEVHDTILKMSGRGDLEFEPMEGITRKDVVRSFGSEKEFQKVAEVVTQPKPGQAEPLSDAVIEAGKRELAEVQAIGLADTLEQVGEAARTGMLIPTEGGFIRVGGFKSLFPELKGMRASPGEIVKAIRKDKENKLYLEIIERLKEGFTEQDVRFLAKEAEQDTEQGFEAFSTALEDLAAQEGITGPALLKERPDVTKLPGPPTAEVRPEGVIIRREAPDTARELFDIENKLVDKRVITRAEVFRLRREAMDLAETRGREFTEVYQQRLRDLAVDADVDISKEITQLEVRALEPPPEPPRVPPPAPPKVPPPEGQEPARKVEAMFNKADAELTALRSRTLKQVRQDLARATLDVSAEVKKQLLERGGAMGREAVIRHDLIRGMGAKADTIFTQAEKEIVGELNKTEQKLLERVIQSRRTIAIDTHRQEVLAIEQERLRSLVPELATAEQMELLKKAEEIIKHPDNLGGKDHKNYLDIVKNSDPETFTKVSQAADRYFAEWRKVLVKLHDAGLITERSFLHMDKVGDYSPRRFIQHIDPDRTYTVGGKIISVPDSGLKRLDAGSARVLENNWRLLLTQGIARSERRIARNEANKALFELATQLPENGIVKLHKKGKVPAESEEIDVMLRGERHRMAMPRELARQWIESDPAINDSIANLVGWVSGANILRPMATGLNPEFALTNMPRDVVHVWLTTHEYSPHLPKFSKQMAADLAATRRDAIFRTGTYVDYINEGGGMNFLTHQGRITGKTTGTWANIQKVLGYTGETSEIWVRLALRHRSILNGKAPHEATWIARNYLDFSQGGWAIKGADTAIPYLNASVQATRGIFRAGKEAPGQLAWKLGQLGGIAGGLYLANRIINKDAWDSVPARDKVNNFIITTPLSFIDDEGNRRWIFFKVAKDQSQRVITSAFEGMMAKMMGDPVDGDQIAQAVEDFIPLTPSSVLPPSMSALLGYWSNKDFWRNEDIWKGKVVAAREEWTNFTHPALKKVGAANISPERFGHVLTQFFTYGNIYTSAVGAGTRQLLEQLGEEERDATTLDILRSTPFLRRLVKATDPFEPFRKEIEDVRLENQTEVFIIHRDLDKLSEQFYRAKKGDKDTGKLDQNVRQFIKRQPPHLQPSLVERHAFFGQVFEIQDRRFWLNLRAMSPEARATVFWTRWMQTDPKERPAIMDQVRALQGIVSPRFVARFDQLKKASQDFNLLRGETR